MSRDFFLLNRCYQISKLCATEPPAGFSLPNAKSRGKPPGKLLELIQMLEQICEIAGSNAQSADATDAQLDDAQRQLLESFERTIVANRFSADEAVKQPAVALIRAIFADAAYFSGLKPLPQYTDVFAYELLFPSWLNLLNATMLPRADNGRARMEGQRQGALFAYLGAVNDRVPETNKIDETMLVGFLTFLASRFDAPHCESMLQRLVDLVRREGNTVLETLDAIDLDSKNARELRQRCGDYLVVKYCTTSTEPTSEFEIAYKRPARRPLPESLSTQLRNLEIVRQWSDYFAIANPLRHIIESDCSISPQYMTAIAKHSQIAGNLLGLLVDRSQENSPRVLPEECQDCLAALLNAEPESIEREFPKLVKLAETVLPRLAGYSEATMKLFCRLLIEDGNGRRLLLQCCEQADQRQALANQLLERAGKSNDYAKFLSTLGCHTVISLSSEATEAKNSLLAIDAVVANRSIGTKELSDLVSDLQANYKDSIHLLASPMMAAAGKTPRLASLYLTLNEVSEKLASVGTADNFSVVRAKYAKLTNMEFD